MHAIQTSAWNEDVLIYMLKTSYNHTSVRLLHVGHAWYMIILCGSISRLEWILVHQSHGVMVCCDTSGLA